MNIETAPLPIAEETLQWRQARAAYFAGVALRHRAVWEMHYNNNQFIKIENIDGIPAVRHCMVEAARARQLGSMIGLDEQWVEQLEKAALLHDSYKGEEVRHMRRKGPSWQSYEEAQTMARQSWEQSGRFTADVMDIAGSVAHESIPLMEEILAKPTDELTPLDKAMLAMHYLDDYTVESDWAKPAGLDGNDLDRRMTKNENNDRYRALNETGREYFNGETAYQAQRRVGHMVEARLAELVTVANDVPPDSFSPLDLPVVIDNRIKHDILANVQA